MSNPKTVKDIMISISKYPHVPYWFTVSKAVQIAKLSLFDQKQYPVPMVVLVFDEKYNLMGTVTLKDLLKGLEDKKTAEQPVNEIMTQARFSVEPTDPVTRAANLMIQNDLELLPVIDDKKHFVGIVRIIEVFNEMSETLLSE